MAKSKFQTSPITFYGNHQKKESAETRPPKKMSRRSSLFHQRYYFLSSALRLLPTVQQWPCHGLEARGHTVVLATA